MSEVFLMRRGGGGGIGNAYAFIVVSYPAGSTCNCTKGTKMVIEGRIQTGSYTNKDGQKVYTTDVIVETQEFAESKQAASGSAAQSAPAPVPDGGDGFMNIPDGIDEDLPFN